MKHKWLVTAGIALVTLGVALAALPKEWIEENFGFEPDGGNGTVELLLAVVPLVMGLWLLVLAAIRRRRNVEGVAAPDAPGVG